jgi:hypothetical protein
MVPNHQIALVALTSGKKYRYRYRDEKLGCNEIV